MLDERTSDRTPHIPPDDGEKGVPRKISFDDFEIEGSQPNDAPEKPKSIPRIKNLKDDLLGGGKKLSKLFGTANDAPPEPEPIYMEEETESPADLPYFSEEELSLVRVRKIPKSDQPSRSAEVKPAVKIEPPPPTPPPPVTAEEPEQDMPEEEQPQPVITPVREVSPVQKQSTLDPSMKVYLDALRGFTSTPRRAGQIRDPRKDFVLLLSDILDLLRDQTDSLSALFFWSNLQKEQLVLECASLDDFAYQHLSPERRYPIEHDALSRVALQGNPQLFENIAPQAERDLIPYYNEPVGIRSFAAMPILFADAIVAVIAIDSTEEEAFSQETLRILSNYSKVITGLVRSYIEAYDLLTSARTLNAARKLFGLTGTNISKVTGIDAERTAEYIMRSLAEAAAELTEWKWLATVSFDDARRIWCISGLQAKSGEPYVLPKTRIDLTESLVGRSLRTGKSECVDRLNQQSIRFTVDEEKSGAIGHSFLVIPVRTSTKNYGALTLEHNESMKYTDVDIETLEHLARSAATALEIFALSEVVSERALTDILTGTYNKRGFKERFTEELARAKTYDEPLSLILFEIDDALKFSDRFGQEDIDTIVLALSKILQFIKHPFDVLARIGEFTFAVLLIKMSDEEAFLWSEKVRQKIVSEVIALSRKSFTITTSIGVAGARRNSNPDELLSAARMALDKAKERGGNEVIVY